MTQDALLTEDDGDTELAEELADIQDDDGMHKLIQASCTQRLARQIIHQAATIRDLQARLLSASGDVRNAALTDADYLAQRDALAKILVRHHMDNSYQHPNALRCAEQILLAGYCLRSPAPPAKREVG